MSTLLAIGLFSLIVIFVSCLQLDVATLTLMSGHALGKQTSRRRLKSLTASFSWGTIFIWWLLISTVCLVLHFSFQELILSSAWWSLLMILSLSQALLLICLLAFQSQLQHPWVIKSFREFLFRRAQKTSSPAEAFSLGITSIVSQLAILLLPLLILGTTLLALQPHWLILNSLILSVALGLPLLVIRLLINFGLSVTQAHRFCLRNRLFFRSLMIVCLLSLCLLSLSYFQTMGLS